MEGCLEAQHQHLPVSDSCSPGLPPVGGWAGVGVLVQGVTGGRTPPENSIPERAQEVAGNHCSQSTSCWVPEHWVPEAGTGFRVEGSLGPTGQL